MILITCTALLIATCALVALLLKRGKKGEEFPVSNIEGEEMILYPITMEKYKELKYEGRLKENVYYIIRNEDEIY